MSHFESLIKYTRKSNVRISLNTVFILEHGIYDIQQVVVLLSIVVYSMHSTNLTEHLHFSDIKGQWGTASTFQNF